MKYQVGFRNHHFLLKGEDGSEVSIAPISGEFHYWRNIVEYWDAILDNIQNKLELKYIQSYIAWEYHETSPNQFDFTGQTTPNRNLDLFLNKCQERGLYVGVRPGPWIYSEMPGGGIPQRWSQKKMTRLDAEFAKEAEIWVKAVSTFLKPHLVTSGGCIISVQVDNEVAGLKEEMMIMGGDPDDFGTYAYWMKHIRWNGNLDGANHAYDTEWEDWDDAEPILSPRTPQEVEHFRDSHAFYEWVQTAWIKRVAQWYHEAGIDVPLYLNTTGQPFPQNPELLGIHSRFVSEPTKIADNIDLIGSDHYPLPLEIDPDHADVIEVGKSGGFAYYDLLGIIFNGKYGAAVSPIAWIAEFRSGGYMASLWESAAARFDQPSYYRYYGLIALLGNFHGWNWYMLVDRDRALVSPMSSDGRLWDHIGQVFRELVHGIHSTDWPAFEPLNPIGLHWHRSQMATYSKTMPTDQTFSIAQKTPFTDVLKALFFGSMGWNLVETRHPFSPETNPVVIYAGWDDLPEKESQDLRNYAEAGGLLIFHGAIPSRVINAEGEHNNPVFEDLPRPNGICRVENNYSLNIPMLGGTVDLSRENYDNSLQVVLGKTRAMATFSIPDPSKDANIKWILAHGMRVGYIIPIGKGHIVVLGFDLHEGIIGDVLRHWDVPIHLKIDNAKVIGSVYAKDTTLAVPYINYGNETVETKFHFSCDASKIYLVRWEFDQTEKTYSGKELAGLSIKVKPKNGDLLTITPKN